MACGSWPLPVRGHTIDGPRTIAYGVGAMADKFEREIEEILAKLDSQLPENERSPISIAAKRQQRAKAQRARAPRTGSLPGLTPTNLLFAGAGIMFAGLILSNFWSPAIWASFAGVVLFVGAFLWSFRRSNRGGTATQPQGHYWRDRYIEYQPGSHLAGGRIKNWFRRK